MASEAQRLIGISLAKIAQSRVCRGGVSLHKNLLVATVLQKARYIFMEEAYNMVHGHYPQHCRQFVISQQHHHHQQQHQQHCNAGESHQKLTQHQLHLQQHHQQQHLMHMEHQQQQSIHHHHQVHQQQQHHLEVEPVQEVADNDQEFQHNLLYGATPSSVIVKNEQKIEHDKENSPPELDTSDQLTYLDLDKNKLQRIQPEFGIKRRRQITELETEEAVLSILPKRIRSDCISSTDSLLMLADESILSEDTDASITSEAEAALISECMAAASAPEVSQLTSIHHLSAAQQGNTTMTASYDHHSDDSGCDSPMEIDRITSLVSIFSFGSLSRSVSTPDLCSAQAMDSDNNSISQRTFLAMTV